MLMADEGQWRQGKQKQGGVRMGLDRSGPVLGSQAISGPGTGLWVWFGPMGEL